jgi:hypothetical protein
MSKPVFLKKYLSFSMYERPQLTGETGSRPKECTGIRFAGNRIDHVIFIADLPGTE